MVQKTAQGTPGWVLHEEGSIPCSCSPASDVLSPGFPGPTNGPRHGRAPSFISPIFLSPGTVRDHPLGFCLLNGSCAIHLPHPMLHAAAHGTGGRTDNQLSAPAHLPPDPSSRQHTECPKCKWRSRYCPTPLKGFSLLQDKDQDLDLGQEGPHTWSPATPQSPLRQLQGCSSHHSWVPSSFSKTYALILELF